MDDRFGPLRINGRVAIPRDELEVRVSRSGGPGGQHVNTSSTRVEARWNLDRSAVLTDGEKVRVRDKLGARIDADGTLRVTASDSRSQRRNRDAAEARLAELVRRALVVPKPRRPSRRPRGADESRLRSKREHAERKRARRWRGED
jgi:ribosome-associated protein